MQLSTIKSVVAVLMPRDSGNNMAAPLSTTAHDNRRFGPRQI